MSTTLRVNSERLKADFDALAEIGKTSAGGVHRPTFSDAHLAARDWFLQLAKRSGFSTRVDSAGNHSARYSPPPLESGVPPATGAADAGASAVSSSRPALLLGSHLDSVPHGGRFDGALGVVAAIEVLRTLEESQLELSVDLEAIDFTDEEGTLVGMLGSSALAGTLDPQELQTPRGGSRRVTRRTATGRTDRDGPCQCPP